MCELSLLAEGWSSCSRTLRCPQASASPLWALAVYALTPPTGPAGRPSALFPAGRCLSELCCLFLLFIVSFFLFTLLFSFLIRSLKRLILGLLYRYEHLEPWKPPLSTVSVTRSQTFRHIKGEIPEMNSSRVTFHAIQSSAVQ